MALPRDVTQGVLAVMIVGTVCLLALRTQTVPDVLGDLALAAVMFFLGRKSAS